MAEKYKYKISNIEVVGHVTKIFLLPIKEKMDFNAGQYVYAKFNHPDISDEYHPFSIASAAHEEEIVLGIKSIGDFTSTLHKLKIGDIADIEGPYGSFDYKKFSQKSQIWIAGGIGITPFLSFLSSLQKDLDEYDIILFYSVKNDANNYFIKDIKDKISKINTSKVRLFNIISDKDGRLDIHKIKKEGTMENTAFLLCGSNEMSTSLIEQLKKEGVNQSQIAYEDFSMK